MAEKSILTDLKVSSKITTNAYHISSDKYQIKIGTPAYPGTNKPSSITWNSDGVSLSQGQAESSGIYIDGDKIVMWSPFDGPFTLYDEDDGSIRFQVDGSSNIYEGTTKLTNRYVRFDAAQSLSSSQQTQARTNIGAGTVNSSDLKTINGLSLIKGGTRTVTSQADLVTGQTYHIHVPAGTSFDVYSVINVSSYSNLITSISITTRDDGESGIKFGYSGGTTSIYGFALSNTQGYQLNNAASDFDVDIVYSSGSYNSDICQFMTFEDNNFNIPINTISISYNTITLNGSSYSYLSSIPTTYKQVVNSSYANYSWGSYSTTSTYGTSSYSLNTTNFLAPGCYNFRIGTSSSTSYGCPYTPSATKTAFIVSVGCHASNSSYPTKVRQDFYCDADNKHYYRFVTRGSSTTYGSWTEDTGGGGTPANMVTTDTTQTITGSKKFTSPIIIGDEYMTYGYIQTSNSALCLSSGSMNPALYLNFSGPLYYNNSCGSEGQVLTSQGGGSAPTWTNAGGVVYYKYKFQFYDQYYETIGYLYIISSINIEWDYDWSQLYQFRNALGGCIFEVGHKAYLAGYMSKNSSTNVYGFIYYNSSGSSTTISSSSVDGSHIFCDKYEL